MRLAFFNVQSGVGVTRGYWQYALRAHRYVIPHDAAVVDALAQLITLERLDVLAPLLASGLRRVPTGPTYPSWRPTKALDYVLCSADVAIKEARVEASTRLADHLPIIVELAS